MNSENHTITQFVVLFTSQKQKKFKTWQDGTMKYDSSNKKLVLIDEKGYNVDRKFNKGGEPCVGDEIEFDGHLVTVESYGEPVVLSDQSGTTALPPQPPSLPDVLPQPQNPSALPTSRLARKRARVTLHQEALQQTLQASSNLTAHTKAPALAQHTHTHTADGYNGQPHFEKFRIPMNLGSSIPATPSLSNSFSNHNNSTQQSSTSPSQMASTALSYRQSGSPSHGEPGTDAQNVQQRPKSEATTAAPIMQRRIRVGLSKRQRSDLINPDSNGLGNKRTEFPGATGEAGSSFMPASHFGNGSSGHPNNVESSSSSKAFSVPLADGISLPLVLQFPSCEKVKMTLKNKGLLKRKRTVPSKFPNPEQYKEVFQRIIHEHLQVLLMNYAAYFYSLQSTIKQRADMERQLRARGIGYYTSCELISQNQYPSNQPRYRLQLRNKEHHSRYSRDDLWVVSACPKFQHSTTFLARSTYFGPSSDNSIEIECVTTRDARIASNLELQKGPLTAIRTISAGTEFMMLDTLQERLERLPLLPYLLDGNRPKKRSKGKQPTEAITLNYIKLTQEDNIDVEQKLRETVEKYHLNEDQESVLRNVAKSTISAPGWDDNIDNPIVLVHGVFGSGKSYLAAVIIIFLREIIDTACQHREPDDMITFRILISSMTNVAVDRILTSLAELGYDHFIRVGSLAKIAKNILPYTAQVKASNNAEINELEQMLEDPRNSDEDNDLIATTIQKFRKNENQSLVQIADVVGTTCMASVFDILGGSTFGLALLDESSQIMEPLTMVPIVRLQCDRLIMIGDPLQLPPTLTTGAEEEITGQGLDKTLFDRLVEVGYEPILLRTQYRCHPNISALSNNMFYSGRLLNGVSSEDRKPLAIGLPSVMFVNVEGKEQRCGKSNSFWNEAEVRIAEYITKGLLSLDISSSKIGIIALYKEQAERLCDFIASKEASVQISTVDAFQGGEKEIIIVSTVRTTDGSFIDNNPRVNVALSRAKRHLIILGNQDILIRNSLWSNVLIHAGEHSITSNDLYKLIPKLQRRDE